MNKNSLKEDSVNETEESQGNAERPMIMRFNPILNLRKLKEKEDDYSKIERIDKRDD